MYGLDIVSWLLERGLDDLRGEFTAEAMAEDLPELQVALRDLDQELEVRDFATQKIEFIIWMFFRNFWLYIMQQLIYCSRRMVISLKKGRPATAILSLLFNGDAGIPHSSVHDDR